MPSSRAYCSCQRRTRDAVVFDVALDVTDLTSTIHELVNCGLIYFSFNSYRTVRHTSYLITRYIKWYAHSYRSRPKHAKKSEISSRCTLNEPFHFTMLWTPNRRECRTRQKLKWATSSPDSTNLSVVNIKHCRPRLLVLQWYNYCKKYCNSFQYCKQVCNTSFLTCIPVGMSILLMPI